MAKMTLTRILVELKTIDKKINEKISTSQLLDLTQKKYAGKTLGSKISVEEFSATEKSNYKSIKDLIKRKENLKRALMQGNSSSFVVISNVAYSIQECIEIKNNVLPIKKTLLNKLIQTRSHVNHLIQTNMAKVDSDVERMIQTNLGKDRKASPEDYDAIAKPFLEANTIEKIDPINIDKEIESLEREIDTFEKEIDIVLSEKNALTEVEVEN